MTPIERAALAALAELRSQADGIYFYDPADRELFREGAPELTEFEGGARLADRFDLAAVVRAVLIELREPSEAMLFGFGVHKARMKGNWRAMIDAALREAATAENGDLPKTD